MEIFNPGWNFNSLNHVESSSRLNSKLLFKMTLQLHVKISARFLRFQLGLGNPRRNFNLGWKFQVFHIIYTRKFLVYFFKINMATLQAHFKWTNDKLINLIKCLQTFASSHVNFSFLNIDSFQWQWIWSNNSDIILLIEVLQISTFCWLQPSFFWPFFATLPV